jgi:predicted S18 family serine protease
MFKEDNVTVDLVEYGSQLNLNVVEIATFAEAVEIILGVKLPTLDGTLKIQDRYKNTMRDVSIDLCSRSDSLVSEVQNANISEALDFIERGDGAFQQGAYYSSASYCFRANVLLRQAIFNKTYSDSEKELSGVLQELQEESSRIKALYAEEDVNTITNLQTYMAVMERIVEAEDILKDSKELLGKNNTPVSDNLAYAKERLFSAVTWSRFFHGEDERIVINVERLKQSCISKISEAEERYNYAKLLLPEGLAKTKEYINNAYIDLNNKNYILCLHSASKAKSESDVILSLLGVKEEFLKDVIDLKLQVARQALIKAQMKDVFPIIAYSYYEYANSLRDFDNFSALLFAEYALELSNLDIYFEEPTVVKVQEKTRLPQLAIGIIVGFLVGVIIARFVISPRPKLATVTTEPIKKPIKKPAKKPAAPRKKG